MNYTTFSQINQRNYDVNYNIRINYNTITITILLLIRNLD